MIQEYTYAIDIAFKIRKIKDSRVASNRNGILQMSNARKETINTELMVAFS